MNKEEFIERYDKERYEKYREQIRKSKRAHPVSPQKANRELRKGGKYYRAMTRYNQTEPRKRRRQIRCVHCYRYREHKQIIAPESQIHHQWIPNTSDYTAIALVEKDQHLHGFIDVILIIEGEITLLTEAETREVG